jgi:hypothetical protein
MIFYTGGGVLVRESSSLCQHILAIPRQPIRYHRRRRIKKKWAKRYGYKTKCIGYGYELNGIGIVGCPHWLRSITESTP